MKHKLFLLLVVVLLFPIPIPLYAQDAPGELAATLEVLNPGVEVRRVNTVNWIAVKVEAIVGVGDVIRTDGTGKARITFFADGVATEIQPGSEFRIDRFEGNDNGFSLSASVLVGQALNRIQRVLDTDSSYDIQTPGMELTVRGTEFAVRVEPSGRSAALVFEGVTAASALGASADVASGYGVRTAVGDALSDVVQASTFEELDAALDGCTAQVQTEGDVRLNVRLGPSRDFPRVSTIDAAEISNLMGVNETGGWYRIEFRGGFGWVFASNVTLEAGCVGLRVFPDTQTEDASLYSELGEKILPDDLILPTSPPESPTGEAG